MNGLSASKINPTYVLEQRVHPSLSVRAAFARPSQKACAAIRQSNRWKQQRGKIFCWEVYL